MIFRGVRPHDNVGACAREAEKLRGENLQLFKEIVAIVGIYFHGEGLGKIEREDAENGFRSPSPWKYIPLFKRTS